MNYDQYGQAVVDCRELCDLLYANPQLDLAHFAVQDCDQYNHSVKQLFANMPVLKSYQLHDISIEQFDAQQQNNWHMPDQYRDMDICAWVLKQCHTEQELQRVGQELLMFQERDAMMLLRYMKYLVDIMQLNHVVWGVGRGSSVSSYVLYKIGTHRIDSLYYDLDPGEFLK